ncbi:MAG: hypothetical protein ACR2KN_03090 [Geodermatophilaceae bacterium]
MQTPDVGGGEVPESTPADSDRTGGTVEEAVEVAADGSRSGGPERDPEDAHPGGSPVEQVRDDPAMTNDGDAGG